MKDKDEVYQIFKLTIENQEEWQTWVLRRDGCCGIANVGGVPGAPRATMY